MGNRFTGGRYTRGGPQLRIPATVEQIEDLRRRAGDEPLATFARRLLWPAVGAARTADDTRVQKCADGRKRS